MRANRVLETTDSIFRNSRQYAHSNEQIFRVMQEGEFSRFVGRRGKRKRKQQQEKSRSSRKSILTKNSNSGVVNNAHFDAMSISSLQSQLLKRYEKIEMASKKVTCIRAYRSSI